LKQGWFDDLPGVGTKLIVLEAGKACYMGSRLAELSLLRENMGSMQREDSALYSRKEEASQCNRTREDSKRKPGRRQN